MGIGIAKLLAAIYKEAKEVETHVHSDERWFGKASAASGETHVADRIGDDSGAFQIDAGNDDWGAWVQILGSDDTPADTGKLWFDGHRAEFVSAERNETYFVQVVAGPSGDEAFAAGNVTEFVLKPLSNQIDSGPIILQTIRVAAGTKVWARCKCPGQNTGTLDFFFGIHEYDV